jgi:two-component system, sensor histidine kinase
VAKDSASHPSLTTRVVRLVVLAAAYYVTGRLGLLLAIPPGYATAVWPPSGIALAGALLFGYSVAPGIFLGSFFVNLGVSLSALSAASLLRTVEAAASIGLGATLQACVGAFLVRRLVGFPTALDEASDVTRFLVLVGPVSCLVNATWSVAALAVTGALAWSAYPFSWWTWWLGDSIGVMTVTPLVFILAAEPRQVWWARRGSVGVSLAVAFLLMTVLFERFSAVEKGAIRSAFEPRAVTLANTLHRDLDNYLEVLYSIGGLYTGTTEVDRQSFRAFVTRSLERHPGIKALEWVPRVPASQRATYEQAARGDGFRAFQITERNSTGDVVAAGLRREYFPVYFVEPYRGNEASLGFDLASNPIRQHALDTARDSGDIASTSRFGLVQETGTSFGVIVCLPVYNRGGSTATVSLRRQNLKGFAGLVLRMDDFMLSSLAGQQPGDVEVRLYDETGPDAEATLARSTAPAAHRDRSSVPVLRQPGGLSWQTSFEVADHRWGIQVLPGPDYHLPHSFQAWTLPLTTLIMTGLLVGLLLIVTGRSLKIEALVEQRTAELMRANAELKEARRRADAAKADADQANQAKSEFLSRMSHELRTPLNAILGFAQVMEMEVLPPEQRESLEHILKGGRHLLELVNEVLDIARIEAGRLRLSLEPIALQEMIRDDLELIAPLAARAGIRLENQMSAAPRRFVLADPQRLRQVLLNLLSNAIKYSRKGGLVVLSQEELPTGRLRIRVRDTGPGIASEKLGELFTPFARLGAEQTGVEGTGLGLALSKHLMEHMGGTIGVETALGQGSTFWIELAMISEPEPTLEDRRQFSRAPSLVLYIDQNHSDFEFIQNVVARRPELRLLPASLGSLGFTLARQHRPHLILLGVNLPDISGEAVLQQLQETPETREIPVVVLGEDLSPTLIERLQAAGARAYLPNPLDVRKFLILLDELIKESKARQVG